MEVIKKNAARFDSLDCVRGIAAIIVMLYHYGDHCNLHYFPGAWVSVDLFFILSGFVISHSYGRKILSGMNFLEFIKIRLIRLAPLYFIALLLGIFAALLTTKGRENEIYTLGVFGIFLIPSDSQMTWPFGLDYVQGSLFPLNDPSWSLFFELFANIFFFWYVSKFKHYSSITFVFLCFLLYIFLTFLTKQVNPGWSYDYMYVGFIRVFYTFFIGALIYGIDNKRNFQFSVAVPVAMFFLCLLNSTKIAFANSVIIAPLAIYVLSQVKINNNFKRIMCSAFGEISYPVYIIHFPIFRLLYPILKRLASPIIVIVIISLTTIAISGLLVQVDCIVRKYLNKKILSRTPLAAA
ncbi:acyltransferase [Chromobacterium vaccinii]|uniref:acyltransferase family protein n=1 Tax=Chromobacterium vaccinii TaxID=1108595 RepID=UPI001E49C07B|nr:acyltransferase [Chromobacterium vaccinii]MCD4487342.1 acyltransferase [Chromobacterium vaccinii]